MNVFISYSTDNSAVSDALKAQLEKLYPASVSVWSMSSLAYGRNWSKEIEERLEAADVFIAIAAGTVREEFAYTGVEIGYFRGSIRHKPIGSTNVERTVIPVLLTDDPPDVLSRVQGAMFAPYPLSVAGVDFSKSSEEISKNTKVDEHHPAYLLLQALERIAAPGCEITSGRRNQLLEQARNLYTTVIDCLRAQVVNDEQLKSKLIVHLSPNNWDLAQAEVTAEGSLVQVFNLTGPPSSWAQITGSLKPAGIGDEWREAIQSILRAVRDGKLEETDQLVSSPRGESTLIRMFAARNVSYYSGRRDIHIYILRPLKEKEYGEAFTTTLWQGVGSCIRLRFLLLEEYDEFAPDVIRTRLRLSLDRVREYARELKVELYAAERQWRIAGLDNPVNLIRVLSEQPERITEMTEVWQEQRDRLLAATAAVISSDEKNVESSTEKWIEAVVEFRKKITAFNAQLILRMLDQLRAAVEPAASDGRDVSDFRTKKKRKKS